MAYAKPCIVFNGPIQQHMFYLDAKVTIVTNEFSVEGIITGISNTEVQLDFCKSYLFEDIIDIY